MGQGSLRDEALLGAVVLAVLALFVWLSLAVGGGAPRDASRYTLLFDSALGLTEDNAVAIAGVKVGIVDEIGIEGRDAKVVIAIAKDVVLHEDAIAAVRAKTLLGEKYLDLDPGAPPAGRLAPGAVIKHNAPTVEIDQLIRSAAQLVASLNAITPPLEVSIGKVGELLSGGDGENVATEVSRTLADLGVLIREAAQLVQGSSGDLQAVLASSRTEVPNAIAKVGQAADKIDRLLAAVDPATLERIASRVDPAVADVEIVLGDLKLAMADVRHASARLDGILGKVDQTLARSEAINERTIREFLQVEGVRVNLIPDARVERRLKRLRNESTPLPVP
jgi:phospholipid/cholesterol/gamma-HCH transport system substrate-binding protein